MRKADLWLQVTSFIKIGWETDPQKSNKINIAVTVGIPRKRERERGEYYTALGFCKVCAWVSSTLSDVFCILIVLQHFGKEGEYFLKKIIIVDETCVNCCDPENERQYRNILEYCHKESSQLENSKLKISAR